MSGLPSQLSEQQIAALSYIEQMYWTRRQLPSNEKLADVTGVRTSTVMSWWNNDSFRTALKFRGVPLTNQPEEDQALTVEQLALANALLNLADKRSVREKLKELNIKSNQYTSWLQQPAFRDYLKKRSEDLFGAHHHTFYSSIIQAMEGGDLQATKLYGEVTGLYNPKLDVNVNVNVIVSRVLEIITKHVRDPEVLARIADDVELLSAPKGRELAG